VKESPLGFAQSKCRVSVLISSMESLHITLAFFSHEGLLSYVIGVCDWMRNRKR
jgi:hypothetical protein